MRIGFDARWYNHSGVGTYVAELLKAFGELPQDFELVTYEDPKNPVPVCGGSHISRVTVRSSKFSLASQFELRAHCKDAQLDLFHCPYQYGAPLLLPCPLVVTVHDLIPFLFRTRSWPKHLLAMPLVAMGYRAAALRAEHIIADSVSTARDAQRLLKVLPSRITPIHLAASEILFHPRREQVETEALFAKYGVRPRYVVAASAGCNWRTKNLETALEALMLSQKRSGIKFQTVIYGPAKGIETISNRNLRSELDIRHVGFLPVRDLAALFRHAESFIMTSLYEGFGLPVVEAMACGCPVVTSNGGSLAEVAADGAQVLDPFDVCGLAQAVSRLLTDAHERHHWRSRALARASEFSWQKTAEQTLAVYRKVCRSESGTEPNLTYLCDSESTRY